MSNGTTGTAASSLPAAGGTSSAGLADWAAPYITGYLGQAQALAQMPYQTYQGPLTAGASQLQSQAFQGIGGLTVPNQGKYTPVGGSFTNAGAPPVMQAPAGSNFYGGGAGNLPVGLSAPSSGGGADQFVGHGAFNQFGQPVGGTQAGMSVAQQYMNPYLQSVLDPQLKEMQRQSTINLQPQLAKMTGAGGYGGSREAIMRSEAGRNLLDAQTGAIGKGYSDAYTQAMNQFNEEQRRKIQEAQFGAEFGLKGLAAQQGIYDQMAKLGGTQRDIEQQGIQADLEEFNRQREFPYKQIQFQRDMISGLPISSVTNTPAQLSGVAQLIGAVGGVDKLLQQTGQSSLGDLLSNLFGGNLGG